MIPSYLRVSNPIDCGGPPVADARGRKILDAILADPNIDIVQACIYGEVDCTDTKMLATAAQLRSQWEEGGIAFYPINRADRELGLGPLFGRYPGESDAVVYGAALHRLGRLRDAVAAIHAELEAGGR